MTKSGAFHRDWAARPLWWDDVPLRRAEADLPGSVDVAIVGSGYSGLSAARVLARTGARVAILEGGMPGFGASSRNHGMVAGGLKLPADLPKRVGERLAEQIRQEAVRSFVDFQNLIKSERLDVDFELSGRFTGAHTPAALRKQYERVEYLKRAFGYTAKVVPREDQKAYIGSDYYYGGLVMEDSASIHPGKFYAGLRKLAEEAGGPIVGEAEVFDISGKPGAFELTTAKGKVRAEQVLLATNAYTGAFNQTLSPFVRRRVVPVTAYMVATEELPVDLAASLLPMNHSGGDTKRSLFAFRLTPDRKRLVFAARAKFRDIPEDEATPILHKFMCDLYPQLKGTGISHTWKGLVCFTFDDLPHLGVHNGIHYVAGCQGNGVVMMPYLGTQAALKILTASEQQCGLDSSFFPTRPMYSGEPWFLPAIGGYYKIRDAVERYIAARFA